MQGSGLRKRQQIMKANRTMFIWVVAASVVVGFSLVLAIFLWQKIAFGEKVLAEKSTTLTALKHNLEVAPDLSDNVRVLNTNQALKSTQLSDDGQPIQSVLDALPAGAYSTALGSSLQAKLLTGVDGVTLDSIRVNPVSGVETTSDSDIEESAIENTISFSFIVSAPSAKSDGLKEVLRRVERSIRAMNLTSLSVEQQGSRLVLSATGYAYYQPSQSIELKEKVVTP